MSAPPSPMYEIDRIKQVLDEEGITTNQSKITEFGDQAVGDFNREMMYVFADTDFPLSQQTFIDADFPAEMFVSAKKIINRIVVGYFWQDTNSDNTVLDKALEELEKFRERLFHQPPARTL